MSANMASAPTQPMGAMLSGRMRARPAWLGGLMSSWQASRTFRATICTRSCRPSRRKDRWWWVWMRHAGISMAAGSLTAATRMPRSTMLCCWLAMARIPSSAIGHRFWLIRNSWGKGWGEDGYMRLLRHDHDRGSEGFCGTDQNPQEGVWCEGGAKEVPVCGMCGILSDATYPEHVTIVPE
ncbi:unnamed protein product [Effrenium voratum]|nr:unnamed protein product [Effrenium voratum]